MNNKYTNFNFNKLIKTIDSSRDSSDEELANAILDLVLFSNEIINKKLLFDLIQIYPSIGSTLKDTPFEYFNQGIKNKIYKKFINNMDIKSFISLKCLELMNEFFDFQYTLCTVYGRGQYKTNIRILVLNKLIYNITFNEDEFFSIITSKKYTELLTEKLDIFIEEYNNYYKKADTIKYNQIDLMIKPIDMKDSKSIIKYM